MLYLIGGAPRAGKSILAQRMLEKNKVAYFSTDTLMMGLAKAMPQLGLKPDDSALERAAIMWPLLRAMAVKILEDEEDYLFEGDVLMPAHAVELHERFGSDVRACFLGYESADALAKVINIRRYAVANQDWTSDCDDAHLLRIVEEFKASSKQLRSESEQYGLAYFDGSTDLFVAIDQAFSYLSS